MFNRKGIFLFFYPKHVPFLFYHLFCNNRWQNTSLQLTTSLTSCTVSFMLGFSRLCYYLVKTGNIKISAVLSTNNDTGVNTLSFPELGDVCIDMDRAETFGLMTVRAKLRNSIIQIIYYQWKLQILSVYQITILIKQVGENGDRLECEFRHLSLAEYMTALHVHITGDSLKGTNI